MRAEQLAPVSINAGTASRRLDIQGLRAVAVLFVVVYHAGLPLPGGFVGVDIFFVISGFVITSMLHREWLSSSRINFGRFYWRRFKRLTPALALVVVVTVLLSALLLSPMGPQQNAALTGLGSIALVANFVIASTTSGYFDAAAETNPLLNTWSLSVEEQFYVFFPSFLVFGWYLARRKAWLRSSPLVIVAVVGSLRSDLCDQSLQGSVTCSLVTFSSCWDSSVPLRASGSSPLVPCSPWSSCGVLCAQHERRVYVGSRG